MPRVVKYVISVEWRQGCKRDSVYLPPCRFEKDAKIAARELVDIGCVESAKVSEVILEQ